MVGGVSGAGIADAPSQPRSRNTPRRSRHAAGSIDSARTPADARRAMRIGVPKEIKTQEFRVGMTPSGVAILVSRGHTVLIEQGAGIGSSIPDEAFVKAGAQI